MSSTDEARIRKLWSKLLGPAAERLRERGAPLLDMGSTGSSWQEPSRDVSDLSELSPDTLGEELRARFEAEGLAELAEVVPALMKLAAELRSATEVEDEVDPFVYVMH